MTIFQRGGLLGLLLLLLSPAAQAQTGTITGTVFDANTGNPVRQAEVEVQGVSGGATAVTELDGSYRFKLPPGTYTLSISAEGYLPAVLEGLTVAAREVTDGSTVLVAEGAVTEVEVTASVEAERATAESVVMERKLAASVSDGISAEEISKSTASNAAGALQKVTGVSVVGEGYVYVRGLGERYSATMLNNALITTTEPEKRVVPLDLFPAQMIDKMQVIKTYSADLPGEFSGGLVRMNTVEFPASRILRVSVSSGFNTQTTGESFQSYPGGGSDFFGFDDGTRELPSAIPSDQRLFRGTFSDAELAEFGRAFNPQWEVQPQGSARPSQSYSVLAGNTFGKLGVVGALTFTNNLQQLPGMFRTFNLAAGEQVQFTNFEQFRPDTEQARLGGIFNVAYRFSTKHRLSVRNTFTHDAEKEARFFQGIDGGKTEFVSNERLRFVERRLFATQIEGEHLTGFKNSVVTWQFGISDSTRDEPDLREIARIRRPGSDEFQFLADPESGIRFFSNLEDRIYEPAVDWSLPFFAGPVVGSFELGFRSTFRERSFTSRRFRFRPAPGARVDLNLPGNELFSRENIRADGIQMQEITRGTDAYEADMDVYAGYFNFDLSLGPKWRVIAGMRVEDSQQNVVTLDPLNPFAQPVTSSLVNRDPLPAVNVVYALTPRQNLRFAWGQTLSRPDFRELTPFEFTEVVGGFSTVGNPDLDQTNIQNFDVRWEWFFGGDQLFALSYFFKDFDDPIELLLEPGANQRRTWINSESATNQGFELEFRRNLGFLAGALQPFSLASNFTFVDSEITIPETIQTSVTNFQRPLIGQSRYLFNAALEWERPKWRSNTRLFVNFFSDRISEVGSFGLDDVVQDGRTTIDVAYDYQLREEGDWKINFDAQNLTDEDFLWTQGDGIRRLYSRGRTFKVGLSFSLLY